MAKWKLKPYCDTNEINTNHLKHCPDSFLKCSKTFFNICVRHAHLSSKITEGVISPILKNKF